MLAVVKLFFVMVFPALLAPTDFAISTLHQDHKVLASKSHTSISVEQHATTLALSESVETQETEAESAPSSGHVALLVPDLKIDVSVYFYYEDKTTSLVPASVLTYLSLFSISPPTIS